MKTRTPTNRLFLWLLAALAGGLGLLACTNPPDPITVYVTPTPPSAASAVSTNPTASASAAETVFQPTNGAITPQPTPYLVPGVTYGPIVSEDYTPAPLHTPLPDFVAEQSCRARVTAPELSLYGEPVPAAAITGLTTGGRILTVTDVITAEDGEQWANTPGGWIRLADGAELAGLRSCAILTGTLPDSAADTTLMGLHVANMQQADAVIQFTRQLVSAGLPLGTLKGLRGTETLLNEVKALSPQTVIVYRAARAPIRERDCPVAPGDDLPDPARTAQDWIDGLLPDWEGVAADYYELVNECAVPLDWLADFSIAAMEIANERELCLLLFSFAGGSPDMANFDDLIPAYQYALDHPCQPQSPHPRTHGIALHAYNIADGGLVSETDVWTGFRHRILRDRLLRLLPDAADLPVYITEAASGGGKTMLPCEDIVRDVLQYTYQLEEDPTVLGFHLWNVGQESPAYDIAACLPALADGLIEYYAR